MVVFALVPCRGTQAPGVWRQGTSWLFPLESSLSGLVENLCWGSLKSYCQVGNVEEVERKPSKGHQSYVGAKRTDTGALALHQQPASEQSAKFGNCYGLSGSWQFRS